MLQQRIHHRVHHVLDPRHQQRVQRIESLVDHLRLHHVLEGVLQTSQLIEGEVRDVDLRHALVLDPEGQLRVDRTQVLRLVMGRDHHQIGLHLLVPRERTPRGRPLQRRVQLHDVQPVPDGSHVVLVAQCFLSFLVLHDVHVARETLVVGIKRLVVEEVLARDLIALRRPPPHHVQRCIRLFPVGTRVHVHPEVLEERDIQLRCKVQEPNTPRILRPVVPVAQVGIRDRHHVVLLGLRPLQLEVRRHLEPRIKRQVQRPIRRLTVRPGHQVSRRMEAQHAMQRPFHVHREGIHCQRQDALARITLARTLPVELDRPRIEIRRPVFQHLRHRSLRRRHLRVRQRSKTVELQLLEVLPKVRRPLHQQVTLRPRLLVLRVEERQPKVVEVHRVSVQLELLRKLPKHRLVDSTHTTRAHVVLAPTRQRIGPSRLPRQHALRPLAAVGRHPEVHPGIVRRPRRISCVLRPLHPRQDLVRNREPGEQDRARLQEETRVRRPIPPQEESRHQEARLVEDVGLMRVFLDRRLGDPTPRNTLGHGQRSNAVQPAIRREAHFIVHRLQHQVVPPDGRAAVDFLAVPRIGPHHRRTRQEAPGRVHLVPRDLLNPARCPRQDRTLREMGQHPARLEPKLHRHQRRTLVVRFNDHLRAENPVDRFIVALVGGLDLPRRRRGRRQPHVLVPAHVHSLAARRPLEATQVHQPLDAGHLHPDRLGFLDGPHFRCKRGQLRICQGMQVLPQPDVLEERRAQRELARRPERVTEPSGMIHPHVRHCSQRVQRHHTPDHPDVLDVLLVRTRPRQRNRPGRQPRRAIRRNPHAQRRSIPVRVTGRSRQETALPIHRHRRRHRSRADQTLHRIVGNRGVPSLDRPEQQPPVQVQQPLIGQGDRVAFPRQGRGGGREMPDRHRQLVGLVDRIQLGQRRQLDGMTEVPDPRCHRIAVHVGPNRLHRRDEVVRKRDHRVRHRIPQFQSKAEGDVIGHRREVPPVPAVRLEVQLRLQVALRPATREQVSPRPRPALQHRNHVHVRVRRHQGRKMEVSRPRCRCLVPGQRRPDQASIRPPQQLQLNPVILVGIQPSRRRQARNAGDIRVQDDGTRPAHHDGFAQHRVGPSTHQQRLRHPQRVQQPELVGVVPDVVRARLRRRVFHHRQHVDRVPRVPRQPVQRVRRQHIAGMVGERQARDRVDDVASKAGNGRDQEEQPGRQLAGHWAHWVQAGMHGQNRIRTFSEPGDPTPGAEGVRSNDENASPGAIEHPL